MDGDPNQNRVWDLLRVAKRPFGTDEEMVERIEMCRELQQLF
jgi:hypothetical protein